MAEVPEVPKKLVDPQDDARARGVPKLYVRHLGTIVISGGSPTFKTGLAAFFQWSKGTRPIEFSYLGSNAGGQAWKAANVAIRAIRTFAGPSYAIVPIWVKVETKDPMSGVIMVKDACVLRLVEMKDDLLTLTDGLPPMNFSPATKQ